MSRNFRSIEWRHKISLDYPFKFYPAENVSLGSSCVEYNIAAIDAS
jgi:hypothetical protein